MNMMTNLFSTFDPSTSIFTQFNWLSSLIFILLVPYSYWLIPSRYNMMWMNFIKIMYKEFYMLFTKKSLPNMIMFFSLIIMIMNNNYLSLFPYIFTSTSHMSFSLTLSLTLWLSVMIFGWLNYYNQMFAHLVPLGTPNILMPFMVLIESISNLIRPGTLAIRLTANMIAGHLLLTLIGSTGSNINFPLLIIMISAQSMLMILEMAVSLIQAYVFTILSILYSNEI